MVYVIRKGILAGVMAISCSLPADPISPRSIGVNELQAINQAPFGDWTAPVNLGAPVNSPFMDNLPELSRDGLALFFSSTRPGGSGQLDLWVTTRASEGEPWAIPTNLGSSVNSSDNDAGASLSPDGHYLYFTSSRAGGAGANDIWVSYRRNIQDHLGWETPVNVADMNGSGFDAGADLRQPEFYFTRGTAGNLDIYMAPFLGRGFGEATLVAELSSSGNDQRPSVRNDRREVFFSSNRPGSLGDDMWTSTRQNPAQPWSTPVNLGATINTTFVDSQGSLSPDGRILLFSSNRPGGNGGLDIWMSTRAVKPN